MIFAQIALSTYSSLENKQQLAYIYHKLKWFTKVESQDNEDESTGVFDDNYKRNVQFVFEEQKPLLTTYCLQWLSRQLSRSLKKY